jgi:hypothetical protein
VGVDEKIPQRGNVLRQTIEENMSALGDVVAADALYVDACVLIKITKEEMYSATVRVLIYGNTVPIYTSLVGFGELVGVLNRKNVQSEVGISMALFGIRNLMIEIDNNLRIKRIEPPHDRLSFYKKADALNDRYPN